MLLRRGDVKINERCQFGQTPLSQAAANGHAAMVELLLEDGNIDTDSKDYSNSTPLQLTAKKFKHSRSALLIVEQLLARGCDVDTRGEGGQTPLNVAAALGHLEIVKLPLETKKVDVNSKDEWYGRTPLFAAVERGHLEVVKLLLGAEQVDIDSQDKDGRTLLFAAVRRGELEVAKLLLETGKVDINLKDKNSNTALRILRTLGRHRSVCNLLLAKNAVY